MAIKVRIKITYEAWFNRFKVNISDGRNVIINKVVMKMNHLFVHRRIDVYNILVVKEPMGQTFNLSW